VSTARASRTASSRARAAALTIAGVPISSPDRLLFPETGITKLDMLRYYEAVAPRMLPHLRGRPLTLKQCAPDVDHCRYLRHAGERAPTQVRVVRIPEQKKVGDYMVIDDLPGLIALAQRNIIEFHTWNATVEALEMPDRLVFDLDPGPEVSWPQVVEAAHDVRSALEAVGLRSWVKTTGGRGLHIVAPVEPSHGWSECLAFARAFATELAAREPGRFTTRFGKEERGARVLIDYLRNSRTNTSVAAYSARARAGAPVSVPIAWEELTARLRPARWTIRTVPHRLEQRPDPWAGYARARQHVPT
jgi:bifunctional non-homologous end joining protein LigD